MLGAHDRPLLAAISAIALAMPVLASAQDAAANMAQSTASQSAARLSFLEGSVSVLPPGAQQWDKVFLNRPLSTGDQLWSDAGSRAEVDLGGVLLRVSDSSEISMLDVSEQALQLGIGVGVVDIALHYADSDQSFEIDTPEVALTLQRDGDYRINVDPDGATTVLVRRGSAHLTDRSGEGISLSDGQGVVFTADGTLDVADAHITDSFDRWCLHRDAQWQQRQQATPAADVPQDLPGAAQLADAGQWSTVPDYGDVWFPTEVVAGWAPYQDGRWAWVPPWGWTWIDSAAWGFAPFHYGRWLRLNGRWGWVPPPTRTHGFAPALISAPASVTSSPPNFSHPRVTAPPPNILHRPVVTTRNPVSAAASALPHVVVSAPAPRPLNAYAAVPSPIGPTIYARDVRPVEHPSFADSPMTGRSTVQPDRVDRPSAVRLPANGTSLTLRQPRVAGASAMPMTPPPPVVPTHGINPPPPPQPHNTQPRSTQPAAPAKPAARAAN
jgi:hypothetical protein